MGELNPDAGEDTERIEVAGERGFDIDVVAISRGFDFPYPQLVKAETWTFYNVLWVERKDGVACRKGLGRVKRKVWEALDKKDVYLVLG